MALQPTPIVACPAGHQYPCGLLRLSMFFTLIFIVIIRSLVLSLILDFWGTWIGLGSHGLSSTASVSATGLTSNCYEIWIRFVWDLGGKHRDLGFIVFRRSLEGNPSTSNGCCRVDGSHDLDIARVVEACIRSRVLSLASVFYLIFLCFNGCSLFHLRELSQVVR